MSKPPIRTRTSGKNRGQKYPIKGSRNVSDRRRDPLLDYSQTKSGELVRVSVENVGKKYKVRKLEFGPNGINESIFIVDADLEYLGLVLIDPSGTSKYEFKDEQGKRVTIKRHDEDYFSVDVRGGSSRLVPENVISDLFEV